MEIGTPLKVTELGKKVGIDVMFAAEATYVGPNNKYPELIFVMYEGLTGSINFHRDFWDAAA